MIKTRTICSSFKMIAAFALVLSLVLFPPTASHAASGMHGTHHASASMGDHDMAGHSHGPTTGKAPHDGAEPVKGDDDTHAASCCNGICISVVLYEDEFSLGDEPTIAAYLMREGQTRSIVASGFLRPPQS